MCLLQCPFESLLDRLDNRKSLRSWAEVFNGKWNPGWVSMSQMFYVRDAYWLHYLSEVTTDHRTRSIFFWDYCLRKNRSAPFGFIPWATVPPPRLRRIHMNRSRHVPRLDLDGFVCFKSIVNTNLVINSSSGPTRASGIDFWPRGRLLLEPMTLTRVKSLENSSSTLKFKPKDSTRSQHSVSRFYWPILTSDPA